MRHYWKPFLGNSLLRAGNTFVYILVQFCWLKNGALVLPCFVASFLSIDPVNLFHYGCKMQEPPLAPIGNTMRLLPLHPNQGLHPVPAGLRLPSQPQGNMPLPTIRLTPIN